MTFAVVIVARNEAHTLPRLFASLGPVFRRGGEVVVLDTGSADATVDVARRHGARVEEVGSRFHYALGPDEAACIDLRFACGGEGPLVQSGDLQFDFGAAREYAGSLPHADHVLQFDASDEVLALDLDFIETALRASEPPRIEYGLRVGGLSLYVSRLYDRRRVRWVGRVHEALWPRNPDAGARPAERTLRCSDAELLVRHHGDSGKTRPYVAGLALEAIERPEAPRWAHYLGRELYFRGWYRSAIPVLDAHAARPDAWLTERAESLCLSGRCLEALGVSSEAESCYRGAIALDASRREPLLRLATLCQTRSDHTGVVEHVMAALAIPRTSAFAEADANYGYLPHALLYWALFWLGRRAEARGHWVLARHLAPDRADVAAHAQLFSRAAAS
jgi:tetratricopeptide (TPR) repeat protein